MAVRSTWRRELLLALALAAPAEAQTAERWREERQRLVADELVPQGITDSLTLAAMRAVPRHEFVPEDQRAWAYVDTPLPIGHDQTISQPFIVATMCELLGLEGDENVLDVGTGSGYAAAVLDELAGRVVSIERIPVLAARARQALDLTGHGDVEVRVGEGEVTLTGTVSDRRAKRRAEHDAESCTGVRDVHNRLTIGGPNTAGRGMRSG